MHKEKLEDAVTRCVDAMDSNQLAEYVWDDLWEYYNDHPDIEVTEKFILDMEVE